MVFTKSKSEKPSRGFFRLPYLHPIIAIHLIPCLHTKRLIKLHHIGHWTIGAIHTGCMLVGKDEGAQGFVAVFNPPNRGLGHKKSLMGGQSINQPWIQIIFPEVAEKTVVGSIQAA